MPIGEICTREVVVVDKHASIKEAAQLMRRYHVGDIIVVEEKGGKRIPVGILTDRDIVIEIFAEEVDPEKVTVADVMSFELATVREQDGIWETIEFMHSKGVRRLPVLAADGSLAGIVTVDDLLELLSGELNALSGIVKREQVKESQLRR